MVAPPGGLASSRPRDVQISGGGPAETRHLRGRRVCVRVFYYVCDRCLVRETSAATDVVVIVAVIDTIAGPPSPSVRVVTPTQGKLEEEVGEEQSDEWQPC